MVAFNLAPIGAVASTDEPYIGQTPADVIGNSVFDRQSISTTMVVASPFILTAANLAANGLTAGQFSQFNCVLGYLSPTRFSSETLLFEFRTDNGSNYPSDTIFWTGSVSLTDTRISVSGSLATLTLTMSPTTFAPAPIDTVFWVTVRTASGNPVSTASNGTFGSNQHLVSQEFRYDSTVSPIVSPLELIGTSLATLGPRGTGVGALAGADVAGLRLSFTVDQGIPPDVGLVQVIG